MNFPYFAVAACVVATSSLNAQLSVDEYLRTAPTVTQTATHTELLNGQAPNAGASEPLWAKLPDGSIIYTTVGALRLQLVNGKIVGTVACYYPQLTTDNRRDLIVA